MEQTVVSFIVRMLFFIPSCIILNKKNRGTGYYILAFFMPLIGLIVAISLSKIEPDEDDNSDQDNSVSLDITKDDN